MTIFFFLVVILFYAIVVVNKFLLTNDSALWFLYVWISKGFFT